MLHIAPSPVGVQFAYGPAVIAEAGSWGTGRKAPAHQFARNSQRFGGCTVARSMLPEQRNDLGIVHAHPDLLQSIETRNVNARAVFCPQDRFGH